MQSPMGKPGTESLFEGSSPFTAETRLRALEVLSDTDTWTGSDWQHAAILLASAIVAVAGDLDKVLNDLPPDAARPLPYLGPPVPTPETTG